MVLAMSSYFLLLACHPASFTTLPPTMHTSITTGVPCKPYLLLPFPCHHHNHSLSHVHAFSPFPVLLLVFYADAYQAPIQLLAIPSSTPRSKPTFLGQDGQRSSIFPSGLTWLFTNQSMSNWGNLDFLGKLKELTLG